MFSFRAFFRMILGVLLACSLTATVLMVSDENFLLLYQEYLIRMERDLLIYSAIIIENISINYSSMVYIIQDLEPLRPYTLLAAGMVMVAIYHGLKDIRETLRHYNKRLRARHISAIGFAFLCAIVQIFYYGSRVPML